MAQKNPTNPIASFYEAQTVATAEIVQAALNGMQRLQQLTLQAMRAGAGGQFSLAQSMAGARDPSEVSRAVAEAGGAEQGMRFQRELLQAISETSNDVVRASHSMMERMREALTSATHGSLTMPAMLPGMPQGDAMTHPMALYDAAMRQWQSAVQQMMEAPSVTMAAASAGSTPSRTPSTATRSTKRKSSARKR